MLRVCLLTDPFDLESFSEHTPEALLPFLKETFPEWPPTARLYKHVVAQDHDITPQCEEDIAALENADGLYYVVVYPEGPLAIIAAVVAVVAVTAVLMLLLTPKIPTLEGGRVESSNNTLGQRVNKPRPNGRIPDIFGTVLSIPELLTVPILIFESNLEVELCYMAIGRGSFTVTDVKDGDTPLDNIAGAGAQFYGPYTSPNSGSPFLEIGTDITQPLWNVIKCNEVNGQLLRAPNYNTIYGYNNIRFVYPDEIQNNSGIDFTKYFQPGDEIVVSYATYTNSSDNQSYSLAGVYDVLSVTSGTITLSDPSDVNAAWDTLSTQSGEATPYLSTYLYTTGERWAGPFIIDFNDMSQVVTNFVALQGMYRVGSSDGKTRGRSVQVLLEVTQLDANDNEIGSPHTFTISVTGDGTDKDLKGSTLYAVLPFTGRAQVRARRITPADTTSTDTIVDEVKWRDCYGTASVPVSHFGDITTVRTRTYATSGATSVKERKLNCKVTRKVKELDSNGNFTGNLVATSHAANIICHMATDPYIGGYFNGSPITQLDSKQILDTVNSVISYFNLQEAGHFNYTFDEDNLSFEEMVQTVADAVFCTAYRQGSLLRLFFERPTTDSTLLFNHRNKVPGSETRTVRFGNYNDNDGIEFDYRSPDDGSTLTVYVPSDRSAQKPKKLQKPGITDYRQAYYHAHRAFNKITYQNTTTEFTTLAEATQLKITERVEIADNTRADVNDGYIVSQVGLKLQLSQPFRAVLGTPNTIYLQLPDGTIDAIPISIWYDDFHIGLNRAPRVALVLDDNTSADVAYQIVGQGYAKATPFLVSEKGPCNQGTMTLTAINYDSRYYQNDRDLS